jgi:hypothetical protein
MPATLSKAALIQRAAAWAKRRGVGFTPARFNEWMKQGVVREGVRDRNEGKRPVYRYGCQHYRRVLQIVRLYSRGTRDRDAILIQLFLKGYGVQPSEVRDALLREFRMARGRINAMVRSTRFDDDREIPPSHKKSMTRSLGEADARFRRVDLVPSPDTMIAAARAARSPDPQDHARRTNIKRRGNLDEAVLVEILGGWLVNDTEFPNEVEVLIGRATDDQYAFARQFIGAIRTFWRMISPAQSSSDWKLATEALFESFHVREFASFHLALALVFADKFKKALERGDKST